METNTWLSLNVEMGISMGLLLVSFLLIYIAFFKDRPRQK